uniref:Uncharacterized protein n=1 Tax=Solanum tuberosum TaxID=4113 RepID=M1DA71_SOLTU
MEANKTQALHNKRKRKTSISNDVQTVDSIDISNEEVDVGSSEIESDDIVRVVAKIHREVEEMKIKVPKNKKTSKGKKENEAPVQPKTASKSKSTEGPCLRFRKGKRETILTREERVEAL